MDMYPSSKVLPYKSIGEAAHEELEYIKGRASGKIRSLRTPWKKYNLAGMGGLEWGSIHTIAGMSGSGKTAILGELETGLFELNPDEPFFVLSFNFEMLSRRLVGRKISKRLSKTVKELYSGDMTPGAKNITEMEIGFAEGYVNELLSKYRIYYVDMPGNIVQIRETILDFYQRFCADSGAGLVITLDHSILIKKLGAQSALEVLYDLGDTLNEMKKRIKCISIVLSQLNRDIEKIDRIKNPALHFPQKSDVFGADALYQYSDVFMITHNPEYLGISKYGPEGVDSEGKIFWHFKKLRDGLPFVGVMANALKYNKIMEVE